MDMHTLTLGENGWRLSMVHRLAARSLAPRSTGNRRGLADSRPVVRAPQTHLLWVKTLQMLAFFPPIPLLLQTHKSYTHNPTVFQFIVFYARGGGLGGSGAEGGVRS